MVIGENKIQFVLVFTVDLDLEPELGSTSIVKIADAIQNDVTVYINLGEDENGFMNEESLSHLIVRKIVDGNEKEVVARNYDLEE